MFIGRLYAGQDFATLLCGQPRHLDPEKYFLIRESFYLAITDALD